MQFTADRPFTFHFVRHGVTELNFRGLRCGGDLDIPLTEVGCDQAFMLGKQIAHLDLGIERIITSNLMRTRQTALIVSGVLGALPIEFAPLLNERSLGEWNSRPIAENEHLLRDGVTPPGGESEEDFSTRVLLALEHLRHRFGERILIVSSRGVGRILNTLLGGEGRLAVSNGEVIEFSTVAADAGGYALRVNRPMQAG